MCTFAVILRHVTERHGPSRSGEERKEEHMTGKWIEVVTSSRFEVIGLFFLKWDQENVEAWRSYYFAHSSRHFNIFLPENL